MMSISPSEKMPVSKQEETRLAELDPQIQSSFFQEASSLQGHLNQYKLESKVDSLIFFSPTLPPGSRPELTGFTQPVYSSFNRRAHRAHGFYDKAPSGAEDDS